MPAEKQILFDALKKSLLLSSRPASLKRNLSLDHQLGSMRFAFPHHSFPLAAVHEFHCADQKQQSPTSGFICSLLSPLLRKKGVIAWISSGRTIFPPALASFGIAAEKIIYIDLKNDRDVSNATEEALKCTSLTAVVGEIREIDLTTSRKFQLAVEHSKVTGFVIRKSPKHISANSFFSRWQISSLQSEAVEDLPGPGFAKWKVDLLKIRNGKPGSWDVICRGNKLEQVITQPNIVIPGKKMVG